MTGSFYIFTLKEASYEAGHSHKQLFCTCLHKIWWILPTVVFFYLKSRQNLSKTPSRWCITDTLYKHSQTHTYFLCIMTLDHSVQSQRETKGHKGICIYKYDWNYTASLSMAEGLSSYDTTIPWKLPFFDTLAWPSPLLPSQGYQGWQHGWCTLGGLQSAVNHQDHKGTSSTQCYIKA